MTIAMFTKLLQIRMVARRMRGFSLRCKILLLLLVSSDASSCRSAGVREKYATSDPEINADIMINTSNNAMVNQAPVEPICKKKIAKEER